MGRDNLLVFDIMAIQTELGDWLGQVVGKFDRLRCPCLVRDMAGITTHVHGSVFGPSRGDLQETVMAHQTEVLRLST